MLNVTLNLFHVSASQSSILLSNIVDPLYSSPWSLFYFSFLTGFSKQIGKQLGVQIGSTC